MPRIQVSPKLIKWALHRSGKNASDLEPKFKKIRKWLSGETAPTFVQLENFARKTSVPFGFFFLQEPPIEKAPVPMHRTLGVGKPHYPSPEYLDTVYSMQRRQEWLRDFLIDSGQEPLGFVGAVSRSDTTSRIVACMRDTLNLAEDWASKRKTWADALRFLVEAMEMAGIVVVVNSVVGNNTHRSLRVSEFRGFVLVDEYAPLTFVNGADAKAAQMFTLAHELAHICVGQSAAFDLREIHPADSPLEKACNQAAAEFLAPADILINSWTSDTEAHLPFDYFAKRFKVSQIVIARRALDLELINREEFLSFYREYRSRDQEERKITESKPIPQSVLQNRRIGKLFATNVVLAVLAGKLSYKDAYRLTDLYGTSFERYAETLGFTGV
jgi:Zn-dependent peptidase ImmA (M78 family)